MRWTHLRDDDEFLDPYVPLNNKKSGFAALFRF